MPRAGAVSIAHRKLADSLDLVCETSERLWRLLSAEIFADETDIYRAEYIWRPSFRLTRVYVSTA